MPLQNVRLCGSYTKQDPEHKPCSQPAIRNKTRCKLHGGKSTGPKTLEGKIRSAEANLKHGLFTKVAVAERLYYREMLLWKDDAAIF